VSGPSEAAVRVARDEIVAEVQDHLAFNVAAYGKAWTGESEDTSFVVAKSADKALAAAHDPANFEDPLDASVRLGDVVEALRHEGDPSLGGGYHDAADFLLRTFGGDRA
jgi:hypothetical protein